MHEANGDLHLVEARRLVDLIEQTGVLRLFLLHLLEPDRGLDPCPPFSAYSTLSWLTLTDKLYKLVSSQLLGGEVKCD